MCFACLALIVVGCATTTSPSVQLPSGNPSSSPTSSASPAPSATTHADCASQTLASLTDVQRVGQVLMIGLTKDVLDDAERDGISRFHFGSVAYTTRASAGVVAVRATADAVQAEATEAATGGVRFFIAANQEGGLIQALQGPGFDTIPSGLGQGAISPTDLEPMAAQWGRQLLAAGINLDFAPVADVVPPGTDAQNAPIGQLEREYGPDPATVSSHVAAFVAGMQEAGVATTVKHFPGLGRVAGNTDATADVVDSVTTRNDPYLEPFATAIRAGVPFVMVSLATYEEIDAAHLAVFSPFVIEGILRSDLGFRGVVISDALGATAVASIPSGTRAIDFLQAGGDMIIINQLAPAIEMAQALASQAATDASFRDRVDDAARHVLQAKDVAGLLPCSD